jgi:hypothetical protein
MCKLHEIFVRDICEVDEPVRIRYPLPSATDVYRFSTPHRATTRDDFRGRHSNDSKYVIVDAISAPHSRHPAELPPQSFTNLDMSRAGDVARHDVEARTAASSARICSQRSRSAASASLVPAKAAIVSV